MADLKNFKDPDIPSLDKILAFPYSYVRNN